MTKRIYSYWMLIVAIVLGFSLSVTSCTDDDNNKSEEEKAQEQGEKTDKFWNVVGQLVSSGEYTADYKNKTFEPTYGIPETEGSLTRIVETNDMQTAAKRFGDLVDADINEDTPSYTYSDPDVGTLTYTRGGTAYEWATVDVQIKQIPNLRKIDKTVEKGTDYTGLALALQPTAEEYAWGGEVRRCYGEVTGVDMGQEVSRLSGLAATKQLGGAVCPDCGQAHPIFQAANTFQPTVAGNDHSQWFVPSTGQWVMMLQSFGARAEYHTEQYVEETGDDSWFRNNAKILDIYMGYSEQNKMRDTFNAAKAQWQQDEYWTANFFDYYNHYERAWGFWGSKGLFHLSTARKEIIAGYPRKSPTPRRR